MAGNVLKEKWQALTDKLGSINRNTVFYIQGIVCLVAAIAMGILCLFSPLNLTVHPGEHRTTIMLSIAEATHDESKEMKAWQDKMEAALEPAREYTESEEKELEKKLAAALKRESEEKAEIDALRLELATAQALKKTAKKKFDRT